MGQQNKNQILLIFKYQCVTKRQKKYFKETNKMHENKSVGNVKCKTWISNKKTKW